MIYIRADANETIGIGHVMRCMAIAHWFKEKQIAYCFLTSQEKSHLFIKEKGFESLCLYSDYQVLEKEIPIIKKILESSLKDNHLFLIDSYFVTKYYLMELKKYAVTAYIDDLDKFSYPVNLLINYNLFSNKMSYGQNKSYLLGSRFAPLREEFCRNSLDNKYKQTNCYREYYNTEQKKNILITIGGSDSLGIIPSFLGYIKENKELKRYHFHIVIGNYSSYLKEIKEFAYAIENVTLHVNVESMSTLMRACDIAVSAGGFTLYELCACGIPTVTISFTDNQLPGVKSFEENGIIPYAGDYRENPIDCIKRVFELIASYIEGKEKTEKIKQKMQLLVDGKGSQRIAERLELLLDEIRK